MILLVGAGVEGRREIGRVLSHRLVDRHRGEVRLDHAEVIPRLVPLGIGGTLEEPEVDHAYPGPLLHRPLVGQGSVTRLLLRRHLPEASHIHDVRIVGHGVGVHLADPDRLGRVAVSDHNVADVDRASEVDVERSHAAVGGAGPEHVVVDGQDVEAISSAGVVHALEEDEVVQACPRPRSRIERDGGSQCTADDDHVRVGLLGAAVPLAQEPCVALRIYRLLAPFVVDVGLVPQLVVAHASPVARDDGVDVIAPVGQGVGGGVGTDGVGQRASPGGRVAQAGDDFQAVLFGQAHDVIVLLPGGAVGFVPSVLEVALAVDLDVLPGKLLADPVEAGVGDHLQ